MNKQNSWPDRNSHAQQLIMRLEECLEECLEEKLKWTFDVEDIVYSIILIVFFNIIGLFFVLNTLYIKIRNRKKEIRNRKKIKQDLLLRSYWPVTARIASKDARTYRIELEQTAVTNLYLSDSLKRQVPTIGHNHYLNVSQAIFEEVREQEIIFFLVAKHSNYWFCAAPSFESAPFGKQFF